MAKRLTVGITVVGGDTSEKGAMWSYGIGQNIAYLAFALQRLADVEDVVLVAGPPGGDNVLGRMFGLRVIQLADAVETLDLIIELGSRALFPDQAERLRRRGGRLVSYMAGNAVVNNFEALAIAGPSGDMPIHGGFDAVWITPQHWRMCRGHAQMVRSPTVREVPHIWSPYSINTAMIRAGRPAYWRPRDGAPARIGVFEPNVNSIKTFHIPLFSAEEAYRKQPDRIASVLLFNAIHLRDNNHALSIRDALDLGRDKKLFFESRHPVPHVMGKHIDLVVTHQWENNLNYLYWDILYLGWPLIHNSDAIRDAGYHYEDFNPASGGDAILAAIEGHDANIDDHRRRAADVLWRFNPENPEVLSAYARLVEDVMTAEPRL